MPEYLAPGVYIEETSFRAKSIEGVSTTTTGFIGPTRYGPLDIEPDLVTSVVEFERTYGGKEKLDFSITGGGEIDNYMWHAVRAFFEEGGKRLYVSRVFARIGSDDDGRARGQLPSSPAPISVRARFPGTAGDARVTFTFKLGQNVLVNLDGQNRIRSVLDRDVVFVSDTQSPIGVPVADGFYLALRDVESNTWRFSSTGDDLSTADFDLNTLSPEGNHVGIVTVTVTIEPMVGGAPFVASDLPLDPAHKRADSPDSVFDYFAESPANLARARTIPIVMENTTALTTGLQVLTAFFDADPGVSVSPPAGLRRALEDPDSPATARSLSIAITSGNDGVRPRAADYGGTEDPNTGRKTGLEQFKDLEDISIVAAPGSTFGYEGASYGLQSRTIVQMLINHAQQMKYRIAVIDAGDGQSIGQVRAMRAQLDSTYGALYYPWVRVLDPLTQREIYLPPSGFVAGIYARNDINRAVYKAPANEVVNLAIGFEQFLNKSQQDVLNPEGINCFRFFEGRGMRLWGARTISSDPEWKYVNLRRYFAYLERSIDKGTQWAVFEPNGVQLWANVRRTIEDFLLNEWQNGALLGEKPEKAYFVKCDRSTMSQNDLDNGRLICLIGVAPLRPAEFVIFRIGQWTADRKI